MKPARGQCDNLGKGESYSKKQKTKNVERTTGQKIVNPQTVDAQVWKEYGIWDVESKTMWNLGAERGRYSLETTPRNKLGTG